MFMKSCVHAAKSSQWLSGWKQNVASWRLSHRQLTGWSVLSALRYALTKSACTALFMSGSRQRPASDSMGVVQKRVTLCGDSQSANQQLCSQPNPQPWRTLALFSMK